jgi:hypothetical protein
VIEYYIDNGDGTGIYETVFKGKTFSFNLSPNNPFVEGPISSKDVLRYGRYETEREIVKAYGKYKNVLPKITNNRKFKS